MLPLRPPYSERIRRETPTVTWVVQCEHSGYRAEVIGPYHIKPGYCPACGRSATATQKENV